jgi:hypothetical protein
VREIELTQGQKAMVDDADFEWLSQWKWCAWWSPSTCSFYAVRRTHRSEGFPRRMIGMHRFILGARSGEQVDHDDHDTLNNQRYNISACTVSQNQANSRLRRDNTSGFKGVSWKRESRKWLATIMVKGKCIYLGLFNNPKDAADAYDDAARSHFGEFACTNLHTVL